MAFKMNTSIGKIYAKIQGTKPYAKAIATAKAPIPATGNVGIPPSPLKKILLGKARTEAKRKAKEAAEKAKNDTLTKAQVAAGRAQEMNDKLTNKAGDIRIDAPSTGDSASASKSTNSKKGGKDPYKKAADKDKNLGSYVAKQKSLKKGTPEWNANQNKINKAYGVKKRYGEGSSTTSTTSTPATTNKSTTKETKTTVNETSVRDQALAKLKKDNKETVKNNLVSQSRATKEEDKPKAKPKRGDTLRRKAEKQTSISERNRLQNRADRKDGRAERRASRVARRNKSITKAEAKEQIGKSRSKQKSTANRSLQDKGKVKSKTYTPEEKAKVNTIKNANRFSTKKVDTSKLDAFDSKKIK